MKIKKSKGERAFQVFNYAFLMLIMLVVTHEMAFARDVSTHVIYMSEGAIEEEGTPERIFGAPESEKTKEFLARFRNASI